MRFRIGVNLGDVVVEDGDIFGDGVNVAARLEGLAEPGGICISASVREHVGNRLDIAFEDAGEQRLKNIERPIRVFRVRPAAPAAEASHPERKGQKPSIAVLPFTNMSGDPEQEYFADGMTEDLITDLSKVSGLSVIARNSVLRTEQGSRHPGNEPAFWRRHVLKAAYARPAWGAHQRPADLTQQGRHPSQWADRFDRDVTGISLQDEIPGTIVEQLKCGCACRKAIEQPYAQRRRLQLLLAGTAFLPPQFDVASLAQQILPQGGGARSQLYTLCRAGRLRLVLFTNHRRMHRGHTERKCDGAAARPTLRSPAAWRYIIRPQRRCGGRIQQGHRARSQSVRTFPLCLCARLGRQRKTPGAVSGRPSFRLMIFAPCYAGADAEDWQAQDR